jgi:putative endonuclease
MSKTGYVYILASKGRRLYTGVTSALRSRVDQHKKKVDPNCFTARYNINMLVYYEVFDGMNEAIARESAIKNMHRAEKIQMIVAFNRTWRDISLDWDKPAEPFDESKMRPPTTF